jgi:hypothetical protein
MLQVCSLNLLFFIGRKVFNSKVALIACAIDSIYIVEIYVENLIIMEVTFKFLFLLLIYLSIYALETKKTKYYALAGIERLKIYGTKESLKFAYWYTLGKTFYLWDKPFYWYEILGVNYYWAFIEHYFILITAIIGIANNGKAKKWNLEKQIILLSIIVMNVVYLPYFTCSRYCYPLMPLMIIFSGDYVHDRICRCRYRDSKARKRRGFINGKETIDTSC